MTPNNHSLTPLALLSLMCFLAFVWGAVVLWHCCTSGGMP